MIHSLKYYENCIKPEDWLSKDSTESIDEVKWIVDDDGTCNELRICLLINGLLLHERRRSRCDGSKE